MDQGKDRSSRYGSYRQGDGGVRHNPNIGRNRSEKNSGKSTLARKPASHDRSLQLTSRHSQSRKISSPIQLHTWKKKWGFCISFSFHATQHLALSPQPCAGAKTKENPKNTLFLDPESRAQHPTTNLYEMRAGTPAVGCRRRKGGVLDGVHGAKGSLLRSIFFVLFVAGQRTGVEKGQERKEKKGDVCVMG